jgi:hypothetical protein
MTGTDRLLAALALLGLIAFLGVIAWFVREPDLIAVFVLVIALAFYDFFIYGARRYRAARERERLSRR